MITLVQTTLEHCRELAPNLSELDRIEMTLLHPQISIKDAIIYSYQLSTESFTLLSDGRVVAIGGCFERNCITGSGGIWMLHIEYLKKKDLVVLARYSQRIVAHYLETYQSLSNIVWEGNHKAIAWLKWLGFEFGKVEKSFIHFKINHLNKEV